MPLTLRLTLSALLSVCATVAQSTGKDWTALFDGHTLSGWKETGFKAHGSIEARDGMLRLGRGRMTGVTWTGEFPKTGYEIRFEAARLEGKDFLSLVFPVGDSFCQWVNGGWDGDVVGLSSLDGNDASENDSSTIHNFEQGRWYAFRLVVTQKRLQGWIDDSPAFNVDIEGRKVGLRFDDTELCAPLGFLTYGTAAGFRNIRYRLLGNE